VITHSGRVVHLVETHQIRDDLLINVRLSIAFNQLHENVNGPSRLVTENLTRCNIVGCNNVCRLVLLNFSKLGASILKVSIKNVHKGSIETDKHFDHRCFFIDSTLLRHLTQNSIQKVIDFSLGLSLRMTVVFVEEASD
jgi:hypothetical protein